MPCAKSLWWNMKVLNRFRGSNLWYINDQTVCLAIRKAQIHKPEITKAYVLFCRHLKLSSLPFPYVTHARTHAQAGTKLKMWALSRLKLTHAHSHMAPTTRSIVAAICWDLLPRFVYHDWLHTNKLVQTILSVCLITETGHCIIREAILAVVFRWNLRLYSQSVWSPKSGKNRHLHRSFGTKAQTHSLCLIIVGRTTLLMN